MRKAIVVLVVLPFLMAGACGDDDGGMIDTPGYHQPSRCCAAYPDTAPGVYEYDTPPWDHTYSGCVGDGDASWEEIQTDHNTCTRELGLVKCSCSNDPESPLVHAYCDFNDPDLPEDCTP